MQVQKFVCKSHDFTVQRWGVLIRLKWEEMGNFFLGNLENHGKISHFFPFFPKTFSCMYVTYVTDRVCPRKSAVFVTPSLC